MLCPKPTRRNRSVAFSLWQWMSALLMLAASHSNVLAAPLWTTASPLLASRFVHTATLLQSGKILIAGGTGADGTSVAYAEIGDPATSGWVQVGSLSTPRSYHTATLLLNGKVLVAGGFNGSSLASTELYDPATNSWSVAGGLATARYQHTATLLSSGKVLVVGGFGGSRLSSTELYDPATNSWSNAGNLATARYLHTANLLPNGKVLLAGGQGNGILSSAEIYDPATNAWMVAASLDNARQLHSATLLPNGKVLLAGGQGIGAAVLTSAELYDPNANSWSTTSNLGTARYDHKATLLGNGKVLVAGGTNSSGILASAEVYDPALNTWSATTGMATARQLHTATLLPNGTVLVAGGFNAASTPRSIPTVELYDSSTNTWAAAGSLAERRLGQPAALLLPSGKALVTGGTDGGVVPSALSSCDLYDSASNSWTVGGSMTSSRSRHTLTLLPSGLVLAVGGITGYGYTLTASAELYDPATSSWTATSNLAKDRNFHTATLLPSGKVLVVGGTNQYSNGLATAELYDPTTSSWSAAGNLSLGRTSHSATLLPSGKVLVAGGSNGVGSVSSAEIYDPVTNSWTTTGSLDIGRYSHTATLLHNGKVLVTGGYNGRNGTGGSNLASAELYEPVSGTWSPAGSLSSAQSYHTATLLPVGKVLVANGLSAEAELYDPLTNRWSAAGTKADYGYGFTATLLASGNVLAAGGYNATAEIYDAGLVTGSARAPTLTALPATLSIAQTVALSGSGFRPTLESSGGGTQSSATNFPIAQVMRLDNGLTRRLTLNPSTPFTDTSITSKINALNGFQPGHALVTVFVNGVASASRITLIVPAAPPVATLDIDQSGSGAHQYHALTDGLLLWRYLAGATGDALTGGALGSTAARTDPAEIKDYLDAVRSRFDIDGNGIVESQTDGLLILRYLLGLRGAALIANALPTSPPLATRNLASEIEAYLQGLMP